MKEKSHNRLATRMLIAMVAGIAAGLGFMAIRENLGADSAVWQAVNRWLFQDITAEGAERAVGLFYICGQLFIRSLQLVIVPMVFTSIVLAIGTIRDASTLGRVSAKTFFWFLLTSFTALILAGVVGLCCYNAGLFNTVLEGLEAGSGSAGSNPLNVILNIVPSNIGATFSVNTGVLSVVFLAIAAGLGMNKLGYDHTCTLSRLCREISDSIVAFLNFVVDRFGPAAIFMLLSRTFATYGITYASAGIAETGTVVQPTSALCGRAISLLPLVHIAVVDAATITPTMLQIMEDLAARDGKLPAQVCFISGPSATADIELVRVEGVHGPMYVDYVIVE